MITIKHDSLSVSLVAGKDFAPETVWLDGVDSVSIRFGGISLILSDQEQVNRLAEAVAEAMGLLILAEAEAEAVAAAHRLVDTIEAEFRA
jgi:hypothetical protein